MLTATNTPRWRAWLLLAVACWAGVAPAFALTFTPGFSLRGPETRVWIFFPQPAETRQENKPQVADPHQGNEGYGYETASGVHVYLYANADPVMGRDPSGRFDLVELQMAMTAVGTLASMALPTITAASSAAFPYLAAFGVASSVSNILRTFYDDDFRSYRTGTVPGALETTLDVAGVGGGYYALQQGFLALRSAINSNRAAVQVVSTTTPIFETGVNITPRSVALNYRTIGGSTNGFRTSVTTVENVESVIGSMDSGRVVISGAQARALENAMGLAPNSLERINIISIIDDIKVRAPASPISGNGWFLGGGAGLPNGGPELTISSVSSAGNAGITQLILEVLD